MERDIERILATWEQLQQATGRKVQQMSVADFVLGAQIFNQEYWSARAYPKIGPDHPQYFDPSLICDALDHNDELGCPNPDCFKFVP